MASKGQALVNQIERYINRYVSFPDWLPGQPLVLALWVIHTWFFQKFPATPYLSIQSTVPGSGKTTLMEALGLLVRNYHQVATLRPLALLRVIDGFEGQTTLGIDEAEKLGSEALGDLRSIITSGYVAGGHHTITINLTKSITFSTFCPKMFATLGRATEVIYARSMIAWLAKAHTPVKFRVDGLKGTPQAMADGIKQGILDYVAGCAVAGRELEIVLPEHLEDPREVEIWCALFSVAKFLDLDAAHMDRFNAACIDMIGLKSGEGANARPKDDPREVQARLYSERALRDLCAVLPEPAKAGRGEAGTATGDIHAAVAVERMKAIPTGPWRHYAGVGLTSDALAGLVKRFVNVNQVVRMERGRDGKTLRGYKGAEVRAAVAKLGPKG